MNRIASRFRHLPLLALALVALTLPYPARAAETIAARIEGMVCSFCAQGLEKKFKATGAVERVKVGMEDKLITLNLKEGQSLPDAEIRRIVNDAGFALESVRREGAAPAKPVATPPAGGA
jgi:copper chaperone CopZ